MEKYIYNDETAYRKAMYLIALQNLATTRRSFYLLCQIKALIEPQNDYKEILADENKKYRALVSALSDIFDNQAQEDQDLGNIKLDEILDFLK